MAAGSALYLNCFIETVPPKKMPEFEWYRDTGPSALDVFLHTAGIKGDDLDLASGSCAACEDG